MEWIHAHELIFHQWLQDFRTPYLDLFFRFLSFFDTHGFYLMLIPILWVGYYWKWGARILFFLLSSAMINTILKAIFDQPRPHDIISSLGIIQLNNPGFPSGAAQSAVMLAGIFIYTNRQKTWAWIAGINYIFWISLSRIYLGVHFPTDVLGGWVCGALLLIAFIYLLPPIEKWIEKTSLITLLIISQILPILFVALYPSNMFVLVNASLMGVSLGLVLCRKFKLFPPKTKKIQEGVFRFIVAFTGLVFLYYGMTSVTVIHPMGKYIVNLLFCYAMGLWITAGFGYIWKCCPFLTLTKKK